MAHQFTGERLTEIRVARGLSQLELARMSSISQSNISLLEANQRKPSLDTAQALADALAVTVIDLQAAPGSTIPPKPGAVPIPPPEALPHPDPTPTAAEVAA